MTEKSIAVLGIDPGYAHLGLAIFVDGRPEMVWGIENKNDRLDIPAIMEWILSAGVAIDLCVIESVHSMPEQGLSSTASFMRSTGELIGMCVGMGIDTYEVTAQTWKRGLDPGGKEVSVNYVTNTYPSVRLFQTPGSRVGNHNMADAVMLAEFGSINFAALRSKIISSRCRSRHGEGVAKKKKRKRNVKREPRGKEGRGRKKKGAEE